MKKSIKILLIVAIIIVLLLLSIFIREIVLSNEGNLDKSNPMTREEVISLLEKGANYKNYYYRCDPSVDTLETEYYIKDGISVCYVDGKLHSWTNFSENEKERITIWDTKADDGKLIATVVKDFTTTESNQMSYDYSLVTDYENYDFEYLGQKEENGRDITVIKMQAIGSNTYTNFYIDTETGVIMARKDVSKALFITTYANYSNRNVQFDVVTDENVTRPDLSEYNVLES